MSSSTIKQEHSAGGVVFKKIDIRYSTFDIRYLLGLHSGYHKWVLPKGLIEPSESALEAALREIKEETGVTAKIIGENPIHTETYSYTATFKPSPDDTNRRVAVYQESAPGQTLVHKTVDFFLMEYVSGDPKDHDWEMSDAGWFTYDEALSKLAFAGERLALRKAHDTISKVSAKI